MRRVVVTGVGLVTPLGLETRQIWQRLLAGESGIVRLDQPWAGTLPSQIAGVVPSGSLANNGFQASEWIDPKEIKRMARFIHLGLAAAAIAFKDSGVAIANENEAHRAGAYVGSGIGGLELVVEGAQTLEKHGVRRLTPFYIPSSLVNLLSGHISIQYQLQGPNSAVATACATGAHAIGDSARLIALGDADLMIAGGAEAALCLAGVGGFCAARALSTHFNDRPTEASRPWDQQRDGFVIAEGAGVVVLEEFEKAKRRGATIYAEVAGYGMSGDAHHITAPGGDGGFRAMRRALETARLKPEDIDYINAHGTSTPLGDDIELGAVERVLGDHAPAMSSTKSMTGHMLGAAGAVESIFAILTLTTGQIPPTINLHEPTKPSRIDLVANTAQERSIDCVLSNSFGFGGTNVSLAFTKV